MGDIIGDDEAARAQLKGRYAIVLDALHQDSEFVGLVQEMFRKKESRFLIDWNAVNKNDDILARQLRDSPMEHIPALEDAFKEYLESKPDFPDKIEQKEIFVGVLDDGNRTSPRQLTSRYLGHLVAVDGIVTKCTITRPKIVTSVHYCEKTKKFTQRNYRDSTTIIGLPTTSAYPTKDDEGNPLTTEFGHCKYRDFQTVSIQEMPELSPAGQLPRSVDIVLQDDLCGQIKPGDRVRVYGIYRALATTAMPHSGVFRTVVIGNALLKLRKDAMSLRFAPGETEEMDKLAKRKDIFSIASKSIAPSIYGLNEVKKGLLCLLLGGEEKILENKTHLRGDVNILMVGDPSTAKSQLLRCVHSIAPLAINTTGRGSTGVGLTAAVTTDNDSGDKRLEAGAMVLADRGVVCIDEFDKMSDADRVAIHEVMEQQTVTIAKAGIHTTLNARCAVVAAANPIYSQYDPSSSPQQNVGLPPSLLSRFDLLFIVLDNMKAYQDKAIANHVISLYNAGIESAKEGEGDTDVYMQDHQDTDKPSEQWNTKMGTDILGTDFLRKYIHYCRIRDPPKLTEEARQYIVSKYKVMREEEKDQKQKTLPITPRLLETHIRLSTAHAKCRLAKKVEVQDTKAAYSLLRYSLFHNVLELDDGEVEDLEDGVSVDDFGGSGSDSGSDGAGDVTTMEHTHEREDDEEDEDGDKDEDEDHDESMDADAYSFDEDDVDSFPTQSFAQRKRKAAVKRLLTPKKSRREDTDTEMATTTATPTPVTSPARINALKELLGGYIKRRHGLTSFTVEDFLKEVNVTHEDAEFTEADVEALADSADIIQVDEGTIYLIT